MSFDLWKKRAGRIVESMAMVSLDDLPDQPYRDYYDSGTTPRETAKKILETEGFFDDPYENPEDELSPWITEIRKAGESREKPGRYLDLEEVGECE